jgi:hypothetical protein
MDKKQLLRVVDLVLLVFFLAAAIWFFLTSDIIYGELWLILFLASVFLYIRYKKLGQLPKKTLSSIATYTVMIVVIVLILTRVLFGWLF